MYRADFQRGGTWGAPPCVQEGRPKRIVPSYVYNASESPRSFNGYATRAGGHRAIGQPPFQKNSLLAENRPLAVSRLGAQ
jgi:hypothetical protein